MRSELVDRRRWVDEATFLDLVGVTALLPGPNSTELAIELGRRRAGTAGLLAAGIAFITPAAVMVTALAWAYTRYGTTEGISDLRYGILPVVVAIVAHAAYKLGRTAIRSPLTAIVGHRSDRRVPRRRQRARSSSPSAPPPPDCGATATGSRAARRWSCPGRCRRCRPPPAGADPDLGLARALRVVPEDRRPALRQRLRPRRVHRGRVRRPPRRAQHRAGRRRRRRRPGHPRAAVHHRHLRRLPAPRRPRRPRRHRRHLPPRLRARRPPRTLHRARRCADLPSGPSSMGSTLRRSASSPASPSTSPTKASTTCSPSPPPLVALGALAGDQAQPHLAHRRGLLVGIAHAVA